MRARINRTSFIISIAGSILLVLFFSILFDGVVYLVKPPESTKQLLEGASFLFYVIFLSIIFFILALKRAQDIGKYVPLLTASFFIGIIGLILLSIVPGEKHANGYGARPPKGFQL